MPGPGRSSRSMPRGSTCGCACRRVGTPSSLRCAQREPRCSPAAPSMRRSRSSAAARRPELMKQRIAEQVALLLDSSDRFDPDRLHQEAVLIAAKADVREELDRLASHVEQAQGLVRKGGAIGRRLDFLSQELNRETNTLCAKANDLELTNIGLELKGVVEQFREQVQNLE